MAEKKRLTPGATSILRHSTSPRMTGKLGEELGRRLWPGAVLALVGELGSGKTVLAQGILKGLGVKERYMVSPSFVLIKEYKGRLPAYHIDLFRLKRGDLEQLGMKEYLFGNGVAIIEWAEKAREIFPSEYLEVYLEFKSQRKRDIHFFPNGKRYQELFNTVKFRIGGNL